MTDLRTASLPSLSTGPNVKLDSNYSRSEASGNQAKNTLYRKKNKKNLQPNPITFLV